MNDVADTLNSIQGAFGAISGVFNNASKELDNAADGIDAQLSTMLKTKNFTDATLQAHNLTNQSNYIADGADGLKHFQDAMEKSSPLSGLTPEQQQERTAVFSQVASKVFMEHLATYTKNTTEFASRALKTNFDNINKLVSTGAISLNEGLEFADNVIKPTFLHGAKGTDTDQLQLAYNQHRQSIIQSGINALPIAQRGMALAKYSSQLGALSSASLETQILDEHHASALSDKNFMQKLVTGGFENANKADAYINSNGLPSTLRTQYNKLTQIKQLNLGQLDDYIKNNTDDKTSVSLAKMWRHEIIKNRGNDMVDWASRNGIAKITPINFMGNDLEQQMANREGNIEMIENKYATHITNPFTSSELKDLQNLFENERPTTIAGIVEQFPKETFRSNILDKTMFSGATWIASQMSSMGTKKNANLVSDFVNMANMAKQMKTSSALRSEFQKVRVSNTLLQNIRNSFAENNNTAESLIAALKLHALTKGEQSVPEAFLRRTLGKDTLHDILPGKFIMNKRSKYVALTNKVYVTNPELANVVSKGISAYIPPNSNANFFTVEGHNPITANIVRATGRFVNLDANTLGIKVVAPNGLDALLTNKDGKLVEVR